MGNISDIEENGVIDVLVFCFVFVEWKLAYQMTPKVVKTTAISLVSHIPKEETLGVCIRTEKV